MNYNRSLDGLRGIAILLVILFHYDFLIACGWLGVQLFFVLSGYLITSILLKEKSNPLDFYLKRFYWRRTLRIFPLYYAYLLFVGVIFILRAIPEDYLKLFPFLATYTFNFFPLINTYSYEDHFFMHFWSLSVEEQFYLIWPLVIFFCSQNQLKAILVFVILLAPLSRLILAQVMLNDGKSIHYVGETVYRFTLGQWDGFAFGALIPVYTLQSKKIPVGKLLMITILVILGTGFYNAYGLFHQGHSPSWSSLGFQIAELINYQHVWSYTLFDFFFFLLILYVTNPFGDNKLKVGTVFNNPVLVYLGKISYGLYVYHWIIWMAFNKYGIKALFPFELLGLLVYLLICLAVASLSYYIFEQPLLIYKNKFYNSFRPVSDEKNSAPV